MATESVRAKVPRLWITAFEFGRRQGNKEVSMIKKLLHTRYRVADLEKTVSFYRDVLGLQEMRRHTSGRGSQLVFFKAPGSEEEIEICKFDESGPVVVGPDLTHLAFEVENMDDFARAAAGQRLSPFRRTASHPGRRCHRLYRCSRRLRNRADRASSKYISLRCISGACDRKFLSLVPGP